MSSSSSGRPEIGTDDFDELFGRKLVHLRELSTVYERLIILTATRDEQQLRKPLDQAAAIIGRIGAIDRTLSAAGLPLVPEAPSDDVRAEIERVQTLNARVTATIAAQQQEVVEQLGEFEAQKRAVRQFRPYTDPDGSRVNLQG